MYKLATQSHLPVPKHELTNEELSDMIRRELRLQETNRMFDNFQPHNAEPWQIPISVARLFNLKLFHVGHTPISNEGNQSYENLIGRRVKGVCFNSEEEEALKEPLLP